MVVDDLSVIEEGLHMLVRQLPTDIMPKDNLATGNHEKLAVLEIRSNLDEFQLLQGLRYFDWITQHAPWLITDRSEKNIAPEEPCQLLLVASEFDDMTKRIAKYLIAEIDCKEYPLGEFPDHSKLIVAQWTKRSAVIN